MISIRSLNPDDGDVLSALAIDAADFGLSDGGNALTALDRKQQIAYLGDSSVVHWIALDDGKVIGSLVTIVLPLPVSPGEELILYEIGVRWSHRRRGVGAALVQQMDAWMAARGISTVWVLTDGDGAEAFYRSCGFVSESPAPTYMLRCTSAR